MKMATSYLMKHKHLLKGVKAYRERLRERNGETPVVQQSDYHKDFMLTIVNEVLASAYQMYGQNPPGPSHPIKQTLGSTLPGVEYDVIIVGAGMAGLSAAYELKKAGLSVKVLEQTERFGGRIFTYGQESGLAPGLYGEGG